VRKVRALAQLLIKEVRSRHSILVEQNGGWQGRKNLAIFAGVGRRDTHGQVSGSSAVAEHTFLAGP
jgi:hypothetical protein